MDRTTRKRFGRLGAGVGLLAGLLVALMLAAPAQANHPGPPSGDGVQPLFTADNPTCGNLDPGTLELKVEPVADGIFTDGFLTVTIDVRDTGDGPVFDWTSNIGVDSIFVKGGPDGNFYNYQDTIGEDKGDTSLHAPINHSNNKFFGLSHISFCYDVVPSIDVVKGGDELSKVGDEVTYKFMITNDGDVPLVLVSATDTLLGDLTATAIANGCGTLAAGASCSFNVNRTVQAGDPDPLLNTVTVEYSGTLPNGSTATVMDSDSHSVNLFQPSVAIDKTGDELSKVGDEVNYTITVDNTSSGDSPNLTCDVNDSLLGLLADDVNLAPGGQHVINTSRTVQAGDPDPLVNTATVICTVAGFGNVLEASNDHSVNLFQPSVAIDKTGDELSKVGDEVNYSFTLSNNSSGDTPALTCTATDSLLGVVFGPAVLPPGDTVVNASRTVQAGDPDPLVNTVTLTCSIEGFPNELEASDDHSVNLFQPSVAIDKTGDELSKVGDEVNYTITVTNTSSADSPNLSCTITDALLGINKNVNLAPAASDVTNDSRTVQAGDPDPLVNTASVDCTVDGFGNVLPTESDSHSVNLFQPSVMVDKTGPAEASEGDTITYSYTITNTSSADSPSLILETVIDNKAGDLTATATAAGCGTLAPSASCSFTANFTIPAGTPSPLVNVVTVDYHPDGFEQNEVKDDDDHSVTIVAAGEGCTPGFWKNHLSAWVPTGFSPNQTLESVFDVPNAFGLDNRTLLQALSFQGGTNLVGAARILLRAGVAAVLNSAHPDVDYPRSTADVIADVNAALASGDRATILALAAELDADNNLGCPL